MLGAAAGTGFNYGFHKLRPYEEPLEVIKLLVEPGGDVDWQDDYGISPLMVAANLGDVNIIQYLVDQSADLGAYDLGKKKTARLAQASNRSCRLIMQSASARSGPTMLVFNEAAVELMSSMMAERGIANTTSEGTCAASPARLPVWTRARPLRAPSNLRAPCRLAIR